MKCSEDTLPQTTSKGPCPNLKRQETLSRKHNPDELERVKTVVTLEGHDVTRGEESPDISILGIDLTKEKRAHDSLPPSPANSIHEDEMIPKESRTRPTDASS
jgi:hypothetical protein